MSQTALYSTPTATIRAIKWRFSIDPFTGRGGYQWRTLTGAWADRKSTRLNSSH